MLDDTVVVHYPTKNRPTYRWPRSTVVSLLNHAQDELTIAMSQGRQSDIAIWTARVKAYSDALGSHI